MDAPEAVPRNAVEVVSTPERARAAVHPERRRLLRALGEEPDSAAGLARRLGESRQRLNYHLRALEEAGLVELAERRRRGNFEERVLRPVARAVVIDPGLAAGDPDALPGPGDRFSAAHLVGCAVRTIREVGRLARRAEAEEKRLATAAIETGLRLGGPADMRDFVEDLAAAVADVVARHHEPGPGSRPFRVTVGAHPARETGEEREDHEDTPEGDGATPEERKDTPEDEGGGER